MESPTHHQQHQLWWSRLEPDFSTDTFPDHLFSDKVTLSDVIQQGENCIKLPDNCINPLLPYCAPAEQNQQKHLPAQVNPSSSQDQYLDHTDICQEHSIQRNGDTVSEESIDHSRLPADVDFLSSDGESHPQSTILMSECYCENHFSEGAPEAPASARVKVMCSFGGRIMPRPVDGKLRYVGGETRIIAIHKHIRFSEFMSKMAQFYGAPLGLKYQLPDEDLDALVSVSSDDDLQNMMEEYDKVGSCGSASRLRLFFFSTPAEVEVSEMKMEGEDGCLFPDQRYVDAINGVSGRLHVNLLEDDAGGLRQVDGGNTVEGNGKTLSFEHANDMSQSKGPSAPSSSPSSPSLASHQASYHKPPALVEFSLQNLNEHLNKVTMGPHGFEADVEHEGSGSSSSTPFHHHNDHHQYDQQFSLAADSPRVLHHDLLNSRGGENWLGLRHVDSQTKLARQSEQYLEYRTNVGGPSEHWHDIQHSRDTVLPQGEHQRLIQQHRHSLPPQQHHHHQQQQHHHQQLPYHHHHQQPIQQQQQGWYRQIDGDSGRADQSLQDMHKQQQLVHQHHQPLHHPHHNASMHDQCSWNAEYHARSVEHNAAPPFIHGSTQISPQILHGLAPAPPYQLGSAPPSPKVGVYDFQGKCSCGLQHSQVHRGITVSIGEQPHNRWLPHYGDQAVRKQGFWNSSRFYDNASYAADSSMWQQASHSMLTAEAEHREHVGGHWQHYPGRHPRDLHLTDCQTRSQAMQYCEPLVHDGDFLPTHERPDMNKRCQCVNCLDNRRQPVEMMTGHSAYSEVPDLVPEWLLHRKGFDLDGGRVPAVRKPFPWVPVHKEEDQRGDFVDDRCIEGESGLYVSQLPGDSESRRAMASHVDGLHHGRKPAIPSVALSSKFPVSDELVSQPLAQGPSDWHPSAKTSLELSGNRSDTLLSEQGQNSNRLMEAYNFSVGKEVTRMNLASSSSVMLEEIDNSTRTALFSDVQHHNYGASTSQSYYREENGMPGIVGRASDVAPVHWSATSGIEFVDLGCNGPKISAAHGDNHLLSPDVIPLGHVSSTSVTSHSGQGVPTPVSIVSNMEQATASPIYDQSPFSSVNMTNFSFAADKTRLPPPEATTDKKPFASCMSATEILADGMVSSVLACCSNEKLSCEISDADQEVAHTDSQKVVQDQAITMEVAGSNTSKISVTEQGKGSTINDVLGNGCLEVFTEEGTRVIHMMQNDELNKTSNQERDSDIGVLGMEDSKKPVLSEAETEAIARGLQIIKNSDLEDLKELGSGTYGTVYHGKWRGSDVAIKRIKASCFNGPPSERERLISDFWREACTLGQLHHPNVVAFYGIVPDGPGGTLATVTEYMVNGSLKQVLHKKDRTIDRRKRLFIAMDAAFGMEYLHSKNIVHFDLKCENLLVNMRDAHRPICKVGDFGLSKVKHQTLVSGGVRGTLPWMAPELLSGKCSMVSDKIDVFSFGIVMWELLTGEEPYENMHCGAIIAGIVNNTLRPSIPSWCDPGWRSLMERCWSGNPAERPAFAEVASELRAIAATMNLK